MRIGLAQYGFGVSTDDNLALIARLCTDARARQVDLLVLPEYASYWNQESFGAGFTEHAQPLDGPFATRLAELAREHGIAVVAGTLEPAGDDDRVSNTLVALGRRGERLAVYRKVHLYAAYGGAEERFLVPGATDQVPVFTLEGTRIALATCYDVRFPEHLRRLSAQGTDVFVLPAVWTPGALKSLHWGTLVRARAIENVAYVAAVTPPVPVSIGESCVVSPDGTVLSGIGGREGLLVADLDPKIVAEERRRNTSLGNARYRVMGERT